MRSDASDPTAIVRLPAQIVLLLLLSVWKLQRERIHHSPYTLYNLNEWLAQWL